MPPDAPSTTVTVPVFALTGTIADIA
jgi:hypothetical protein